VFQSLKRDVAFFHGYLKLFPAEKKEGFNRSSAMWPSSTLSMLNVETITVGFQSLKRDVAFFHMWCTNLN